MMANNKHVPLRMCVGCRNMFKKSELIRVVKKDDKLLIDIEKKILSRGIYLCKSSECILKGQKRKTFSNLLKNKVPDEFLEELNKQVEY